MDDDVDAAELPCYRLRHHDAALRGRDIGRHEQSSSGAIFGAAARGHEDLGAALPQPCCHRLTDPFGAAGNECSPAGKLRWMAPTAPAHSWRDLQSRDAVRLEDEDVAQLHGLPEKAPDTRPTTTILPSFEAIESGSTMGRYFL